MSSDGGDGALTGPVTAIRGNVIYVEAQPGAPGKTRGQAMHSASFYAASLAGLMTQLAAEVEQVSATSPDRQALGSLAAATRDFASEMEHLSEAILRLPEETDGTG